MVPSGTQYIWNCSSLCEITSFLQNSDYIWQTSHRIDSRHTRSVVKIAQKTTNGNASDKIREKRGCCRTKNGLPSCARWLQIAVIHVLSHFSAYEHLSYAPHTVCGSISHVTDSVIQKKKNCPPEDTTCTVGHLHNILIYT